MFADDLLLFAEATMDQIKEVTGVIKTFSKASGLKINVKKSSIVFSKRTNKDIRDKLTKYSGFKEQRDLGRYLGAMITSNRKGKENFKDILERVHNKLKRWKSKCLSLAGRLTLAQSVLSLALNFSMQHERVPRGICLEVEKPQRSFIWGDEPEKKKIHLISWKTLCQLKHLGGLGFRRINTMNDAFLLKIIWQALDNLEALWNKGILINKALNPDSVDVESLVWEWTKQNGEWDIDRLNQNLPPEIVMEIICKPPPQAENDDDRRGWRLSYDENFSINSTYKELRKWPSEEKTVWKQLWSWRGPQRAKIFLWTAMHEKFMINQRRARIFGGARDCTLCTGGQEDIFHVLRNFPKASTIWVNLIKTEEIPNFFQLEWDNWIERNLQ
ncbi:hypothetical protein AHAS_Ahas17G0194400 [Arachis hypogaea]